MQLVRCHRWSVDAYRAYVKEIEAAAVDVARPGSLGSRGPLHALGLRAVGGKHGIVRAHGKASRRGRCASRDEVALRRGRIAEESRRSRDLAPRQRGHPDRIVVGGRAIDRILDHRRCVVARRCDDRPCPGEDAGHRRGSRRVSSRLCRAVREDVAADEGFDLAVHLQLFEGVVRRRADQNAPGGEAHHLRGIRYQRYGGAALQNTEAWQRADVPAPIAPDAQIVGEIVRHRRRGHPGGAGIDRGEALFGARHESVHSGESRIGRDVRADPRHVVELVPGGVHIADPRRLRPGATRRRGRPAHAQELRRVRRREPARWFPPAGAALRSGRGRSDRQPRWWGPPSRRRRPCPRKKS